MVTVPVRRKRMSESSAPLHTVRGQRVILDFDLAIIYGTETRTLNQALKRNAFRFPVDFAFQLTVAESASLPRPPQPSGSQGPDSNSSQTVMSSSKHRGATYRPWAFTEHGALMAANILRSRQAVEMSVFVIRAFVRLREEFVTNATILKRLAEIDRTLLVHDSALRDLFQKLLPLLSAPPPPSKPKIGFHPGNR
jgi:hypothetical protein